MIKEEIVSQIQLLCPREDKTNKYGYRFIESVAETVLKEMYGDLYKINPGLLGQYTKAYGVTTTIVVSRETGSTGIFYSTIPEKIINLPCKGSGVRRIYPGKAEAGVFVPVDAREVDILYNSDVASVTSKIGYMVRQDTRVDYYNMNTTLYTAGVRMDLLIPFSKYLDSDVVLIPDLGEKDGGSFLSRVMAILGIVQPVDLKDDNADPKQEKVKK